jgi:hypothetical protein
VRFCGGESSTSWGIFVVECEEVTAEEKDRKKFAIRWSVLKAKRRDGVKRFMQERVFNKDPYLVVSCSLKNILKLFKNIIEN